MYISQWYHSIPFFISQRMAVLSTDPERSNLLSEDQLMSYTSSKWLLQHSTCLRLEISHKYGQQEGQHPLTGERAANFRLLANQWAKHRLVTQWRHGCRAMRRSMCAMQVLPILVGPFAFSYQGNGATPCQYIDTTRNVIDCTTTLLLTVFI